MSQNFEYKLRYVRVCPIAIVAVDRFVEAPFGGPKLEV